MDNKRKTITISVQDDFSRQLKEFARLMDASQGELSDFQTSAKKGMGFADMAEKVDHFTTALKNTWSIASNVVNTLTSMANEGQKIGQTSAAFERLAGGAENANQWISAMKESSRGALTTYEATNQAIQLMTMGLADSAEEAGRFMEIAAITKAINPELGTMENTITNIGMTLANDSWMRLDQLGVDAVKLRERIEELKNEGIAMTEAFDIGVMEQLEANASLIGTDVLEIGKNTAEMQAEWRQAKENASEFALVVMEEISPALSDAFTTASQIFQILTWMADGTWAPKINWPDPPDWFKQARYDLGFGQNPNLEMKDEAAPGITYEDLATAAIADQEKWNIEAQKRAGETFIKDLHAQRGEVQATIGAVYNSSEARAMTFDYYKQLGDYYAGLNTAANIQAQRQLKNWAESTNQAMLGSFRGPLETAAPTAIERGGSLMAPPQVTQTEFHPPQYLQDMYGDQLRSNAGRFLQAGLGGETGDLLARAGQQNIMSGLDMALNGGGQPGPVSLQLQGAKDAVYDMDALATASAAFAANIEKVNAMRPENLADKFGLDPDSFDVDVFGEMSSALRDAGVNADIAAAALENYQLMTGMATGGSQLFAGQLESLSRQLDNGTLDAETYAQKVIELGQMDLSNIDQTVSDMIAGGDLEGAKDFIDTLATMDFEALKESLDTLAPSEEEGNQFQSLMDAANEMEESITTNSDNILTAMSENMQTMNGDWIETFGGMKSSAIGDMEEIKKYINDNFTGGQFVMKVEAYVGSTQIGNDTIAPGGASIPQFAEGGFTGRGSNPFLAMLHPNEMVVPLNKMPMGGGGGVSIGTVVIQDSGDPVKTWNALEQEARRRNRPFGRGQAGVS